MKTSTFYTNSPNLYQTKHKITEITEENIHIDM